MSKSTATATKTTTITPESALDFYRAATDNKGRAEVRSFVKSSIESAVMNGDLPTAQAWLSVTLSTDNTPAKVETDYVALTAARAWVLQSAVGMILSGATLPDGTPDDIDMDAVNAAFAAYESHDVTWTDDMRDSAHKFAGAKVTKGSGRNIGDAIVRAFDGCDAGTILKVSEVARRGADGDYRPSGGAIVAHLDGKSPVSGYTLTVHDSGVKGVRFDG